MYQGIIFAGFGGQGVISAGILLSYAGMLEDKYVTFFPSYGAEMRGGTANCSVVISTEEVASPIVAHPDTLVVMNEPSFAAFEPQVKDGGLLIVNSSLVTAKSKRSGLDVVPVDANDIAASVASPKSANMVMVGAFCKKTGALKLDSVIKAIPKVYTKFSEDLIKKNVDALHKGFDAC